MSTNTVTVSGLKGGVQYVPAGPFAIGDPVFSIDEHIRIDKAADVVELNGRRILYQECFLYRTDQIPEYNRGDADTEDIIRHYVSELKQLMEEYPEEMENLTALEADDNSVTIHGELLDNGSYAGESEAEVIPLSPRERRKIRREITSLKENENE